MANYQVACKRHKSYMYSPDCLQVTDGELGLHYVKVLTCGGSDRGCICPLLISILQVGLEALQQYK